MSALHTPGPWRLAVGNERTDRTRHFVWSAAYTKEEREDDSPYCIATVEPRGKVATLEANADLIAAAPELLDALRTLAGDIEARAYRLDNSTLDALVAANALLDRLAGFPLVLA